MQPEQCIYLPVEIIFFFQYPFPVSFKVLNMSFIISKNILHSSDYFLHRRVLFRYFIPAANRYIHIIGSRSSPAGYHAASVNCSLPRNPVHPRMISEINVQFAGNKQLLQFSPRKVLQRNKSQIRSSLHQPARKSQPFLRIVKHNRISLARNGIGNKFCINVIFQRI